MITSVRNRQVVAAARLQKRGIREQHRLFLVEGAQATEEALAAGAVEAIFHVPGAAERIAEIVRRAADAGVRPTAVSDAVMTHLTSTVTPQPVVAVSRFVDEGLDALVGSERLVPVLCSVRDPGNAGTIVRTADAAGAAGVVFAEASVDVYNTKAVRASAGSLFHLPIVRDAGTVAGIVELLRDGGARVLAADADGGESVFDADLTRPTAILFGNEAWGLPPDVRDLADATVRVPIAGHAESLNLAAAATVIMFEAARQRASGGLAATLAEAAHDLRAPLVGLRGFASTLAARWDDLDERKRREALGLMAFDAERAAAMLELAIAIARGEARRTRPGERARLEDVGASISGAFALIEERPDVRWEASGEVAVDRRTLHAITFVLADIASPGSPEEPVTVASESSADGVAITVSREGAAAFGDVRSREGSMQLLRRAIAATGGGVDQATGDRLIVRLPR